MQHGNDRSAWIAFSLVTDLFLPVLEDSGHTEQSWGFRLCVIPSWPGKG